MAQINLLKQKTIGQSFQAVFPVYATRFLLVVLLVVVAYYVWIFISLKKTNAQIAETEAKLAQNQEAISKIQDTDQLFARQNQLKALEGIITEHLYWSQLLPEVAKVTLKRATYSNFAIHPDNTLSLTVSVPNFEDFDKFLQVFDIPKVNESFSEVRVSSFHESETDETSVVQFDVKMKFNPAILEYKKVK